MIDLPKVAFLVDEPGWAFDRWTETLARRLVRAGFQVKRCYRATLPERIDEDFVMVCWWPDTSLVAPRISPAQKILCRVADMVTWNRHAPGEWQALFQQLIPFVHTYVASSQEIEHELRATGLRNVIRLGDCVDTARFYGKRFVPSAIPIVGWCGNPKALEWMGFVDLKGVSVVESLRGDPKVELSVAVGLPPDEMPRWYRSIDIYVCASRNEGTPLPVLEAMATGNIVVSTAVGIVPEVDSKGVFIFNGTPSGLHDAINELIQIRSHWPHLGGLNRQCAVESWSSGGAAIRLSNWLRMTASPSEEVQHADH